MTAKAFYSEEHRCWFVPVAVEILHEGAVDEPVRVALRDGTLLITKLGGEGETG